MKVEPSLSGFTLIPESELERWAIQQWRENPPSWHPSLTYNGRPDPDKMMIRFDEEPWAPRVGDSIRCKMTGAIGEVVSVPPPSVEAIIWGLCCKLMSGPDLYDAHVNPHDYELVARKPDQP